MEIKNLHKSFDGKVIFNGFNTKIPENKRTYIVGPSGSGKTTLLRIIAGLDKEYTGEIIDKSDDYAIVFQEPRLFPYLSVEDNISIVEKTKNNEKLSKIIQIVELENDRNLLPHELSGGMKMRVSLARALYYDKDLILMDEPFSALDDDLKERILPKIFELSKNKTLIIISHDNKEVEKYAENIIELH